MASGSLLESLFQRSLEDLIKGLRLQLIGESNFISKAVDEIRREIKSTDLSTKATALHKLSYLSALHGVDMSWAAFHAVELVSSSRFSHKKIGYHAVSQSFNEHTAVLLLITNQLRKDLTSTNENEVSLALQCLSSIATDDLARDLTPEVFSILGSNKVFVRKKAIGVVLIIFEKYPDAVRVCFKRLVDNLESTDPQILSAAVGVFCELTDRDPKSYLPLAPAFYKILVDSRNNWVLIKVLKIFAKLAVLEPRLARRIVDPICDHMRRTGAKSLLFECIRTVVTSLTEYESAVKLAVEKIREFLVDDDLNLKYIGLHALSILAPKHSWAVLENKEFVIKSLSDEDPNVKLESLRLLMGMVSETNVAEITEVLLSYALKSDPQFCNEILGSILSTCSRNFYEIVVDFDWYVSLLGEISRIPHFQKGEEIEHQLIDIGTRVKDVRPELVRVGRDLLIDPALLSNQFLHRVLSAAAWVSGEYIELSRDASEIVDALLLPRTFLLPPSIRAVYVHAAFKVLIFCLRLYFLQSVTKASSSGHDDSEVGVQESVYGRESSGSYDLVNCNKDGEFDRRTPNPDTEDYENVSVNHGSTSGSGPSVSNQFTRELIVNMLNRIEMGLEPLSISHDVEIQERARNVLGFMYLIKQQMFNEGAIEEREVDASKIIKLIHDSFLEEIGPVSMSAQDSVPIPDGLVLEENLGGLEEICGDVQVTSSNSCSFGNPQYGDKVTFQEERQVSKESTSLLAEHRKQHGIYYLSSEKSDIVPNDVSNEYPPANDPKSNDDVNDLVKLTEKAFVSKKKSNSAKPRPVVVKLDGGDEVGVIPVRPEIKDDLLSGAVRDILLRKPSDKDLVKEKGKEKQHVDTYKETIQNASKVDETDNENRNKRQSKNHSRSKERRREKNPEQREENGQKEKHKRSRRQSRHKALQRPDEPINVVSQSPEIPDFLL